MVAASHGRTEPRRRYRVEHRGAARQARSARGVSQGRNAVLAPRCFEDLTYWARLDRKITNKILGLMGECLRTPFTGTGSPEPLRYWPGGAWSRRITQEHRLVCRVFDDRVEFLEARHHYGS
ncbi:MAG: Txe/YoeB family addiction module toxin [Dehalococcoidia bacterium]